MTTTLKLLESAVAPHPGDEAARHLRLRMLGDPTSDFPPESEPFSGEWSLSPKERAERRSQWERSWGIFIAAKTPSVESLVPSVLKRGLVIRDEEAALFFEALRAKARKA